MAQGSIDVKVSARSVSPDRLQARQAAQRARDQQETGQDTGVFVGAALNYGRGVLYALLDLATAVREHTEATKPVELMAPLVAERVEGTLGGGRLAPLDPPEEGRCPATFRARPAALEQQCAYDEGHEGPHSYWGGERSAALLPLPLAACGLETGGGVALVIAAVLLGLAACMWAAGGRRR